MTKFKKFLQELFKSCKGESEDVDKAAVPQEQKIFTIQLLISATNNFENKLGQGVFGPVFKINALIIALGILTSPVPSANVNITGLLEKAGCKRFVKLITDTGVIDVSGVKVRNSAYAFELTEQFSPVSILKSYLNESRRVPSASKSANSSPAAQELIFKLKKKLLLS